MELGADGIIVSNHGGRWATTSQLIHYCFHYWSFWSHELLLAPQHLHSKLFNQRSPGDIAG